MRNKIDPKKGIPATPEEKMIFGVNPGATFSTIYFPAEQTPDFLRQADSVEIEGERFYRYPDFRIFDKVKRHLRGFAYNPVQFHLKHHVIDGVHLVHWLVSYRDPEPYIMETTINPTENREIIPLLSKSRFIMLNLYQNCEYCETRVVDNPLREQAAKIYDLVNDIPEQPKHIFMPAKKRFEEITPLYYQSFEWSQPLMTMRVNFV